MIEIRKAEKEDVPAILNLIQKLALYEKAPEEVEVSAEELMRDGFGKHPEFFAFMAESRGEVVGMALYYIKYSTWKGKCVYLDDIIVSESHRRSGIGKLLFDKVVEASIELKARKLEWQVLKWNDPAIYFYKKIDSLFDDEWLNCKLTNHQMMKYKPGPFQSVQNESI